MRKTFRSLREKGKYLNLIENEEQALKEKKEEQLLATTFFEWIRKYNFRMKQRQLLFKSLSYWS